MYGDLLYMETSFFYMEVSFLWKLDSKEVYEELVSETHMFMGGNYWQREHKGSSSQEVIKIQRPFFTLSKY